MHLSGFLRQFATLRSRKWQRRCDVMEKIQSLLMQLHRLQTRKSTRRYWPQFESVLEMSRNRPNQTLERTADRHEDLLSMTSSLNSEAQLAVVSGGSAPSR